MTLRNSNLDRLIVLIAIVLIAEHVATGVRRWRRDRGNVDDWAPSGGPP